jgi:hypothetical protein
VQLNLANGECNGNSEINFELTGFRVFGFVKSDSKCSSGSVAHGNELVELLGASDVVIATTRSKSEDGSFVFENVAPGSYSLRTAGSTIPIQVIGSNLEIRPDIVAGGYRLSGAVAGVNEKSAVEVVLFSHSTQGIKCDGFDSKTYVRNKQWGSPVCVVKTDASGAFTFENVPCGDFVVAPHLSSAASEATFHFTPEYASVTIDSESKNIASSPFTLAGITLSGSVLNAKSKPVSDVHVTLNNPKGTSFNAISNGEGKYSLDKVPTGKYTLKAEKNGFVFETSNFEVTTTSVSLPTIIVSKIDVCGKVSIPQPPAGVSTGAGRKVSLKSAEIGDLQVSTDKSGSFCFQVAASSKAHNVVISPVITAYEKQAGLLLSNFETSLSIDTVPINNVHFSQSLLTIRGQVICILQPCDQRISIQLTPVAGGESITTGLSPATGAATTTQGGHANFEFHSLVPAKYIIKMEKPEWCWQKETIEVEISKENSENLVEFVQSGYHLRVASTHDLDLQYQSPASGSSTHKKQKESPAIATLHVKQDSVPNVFCLPDAGTYSFKPVSDVFQFESNNYTFSTDEPHGPSTVLKIVAKRVKVEGQIVIVVAGLHKTLASAIITHSNGEQIEDYVTLTPKKDDDRTLQYSIWAEQGDEIELKPFSKIMILYYPQKVSTKVSKLVPGITLPTIQGRYGVHISGTVSPAVSGVVINIFDESDDSLVLGDITTDEKGAYSAGPLLDTRTYRVEASAAGFHLAQQADDNSSSSKSSSEKRINFKASKLGSLKVRVVSADDINGQSPVVGVLLSMSGGGGYRSNNATNENGDVVFANIFPGDYYLMPLLKEYTFAKDKKPSGGEASVPLYQQPLAVQVKEGSDQVLLFGSRIAYSVFGKVTSLNGQPEKAVFVEAKSGQDLLEKTQTDQNGQYRLRGLIPGQQYSLHISTQTSSHIERTSPSDYTFTVGKEDILDRNFLAFRKSSSRFEVFGRVITNSSLLPYITVQLWEEVGDSNEKAAAPSEHPVRELKLFNDVDFFSFAGLSRSKYSLKLKLDSSLSKAIYSINPDLATKKISFSADEPSLLIDLHLAAETTSETVEIPSGQLYATILVIVAFVGFYYRKPITKFIKAKQQQQQQQSSGNKTPNKSRKTPVEDRFVANLNKFGKN